MTSDEQSSIAAHFADRGRVAEYLAAPDPQNEARRDLVRRMVLVNVPAGSRVLEVGCGIGTLTVELAQAGMLCKAIDASEEMIRQARDRVGAAAEIELKDLFDENLSGHFAAVIANGVAPYYRDTGDL
jgi:2-polyprenyl-3-methyl-5-hydroxy-6-metoxy-1,4-benzoquinol methylase